MKLVHFIVAILMASIGAAWATTEIERDLDGNASVFQTSASQTTSQKTGGSDARR